MGTRAFHLLLFTLIVLFGTVASQADQLTQYWQRQEPGVRQAMLLAAKKSPVDVRTLLGVALIRTAEDATADAVTAWHAYYLAAPASWAAAAYWPTFTHLVEETGRWNLQEEAARIILASPSAPLELRTAARLALADALDRAGKFAEADAARTRLGYIRKWRGIGPFENVSHSGFAKSFPPENAIDFTKTYPGIDDKTLGWHDLLVVSRAGKCLIGTALGDESESAFYAVTAIHVPKAQSALLHYNPTGASKIFLNGRQILNDELYRDISESPSDCFSVPVSFRQGWNTVLVKLTSDEYVEAGFTLRFTTPQGSDLIFQVDPAQARTEKMIVPSANEVKTIETATVTRLRKQGNAPEVLAALGCQLRNTNDYDAAAEVLHTALKSAPSSGWLHWELCKTLWDDDQIDEGNTERDLARKYTPNNIVDAEDDYLNDQSESLDPADYLKQVKAMFARHPGSATLQRQLSDAYFNADMDSEGITAAENAVRLAGGIESLVNLLDAYKYHEQNVEADKRLQDALRQNPYAEDLLVRRATTLSERGKTTEALAQYQRLLQIQPRPRYRQRMVDLYLGKKDYTMAERTLKTLRQQCPQDADVCTKLADLLQQQKRTPEAITMYKVAMRLNPTDISLRSKVKVIAGEKPVVDLAPAMPIEPILEAAKKIETVPGASAIVLLDEGRQVVYPDYASELHVHTLIKVLDKAGVESFSDFDLDDPTSTSHVTLEKGRLLKANGKVEDVSDDSYGSTASFPSLAPGDILDVTYRVEDHARGALARQFWHDWDFTADQLPVRLSRYVLVSPPKMAITVQPHGEIVEQPASEVQGWRVREWQVKDVPAGKMEYGSPGARDIERWLDVSTIGSWQEIVRWYRDLAQPRCEPNDTIRAKAIELTKDAKTEEEKIRALASYVSREIRYQSTPFRMSAYIPTEGKKVMREGYGDCKDKAALLVALLAAVDIKADMALVNVRSDGLTPYLPSPRFNHAIARVQTANGPLWIDATADQFEYGVLPSEDQQVWGLVINESTADLVETPTSAPTTQLCDMTYDLALDEQHTLRGGCRLSVQGNTGGMLRSLITQVPESAREIMLRSVVSQMLPGAVYESGSIDNLENQDKPLALNMKFHAERYSAMAGDIVVVRLPWKLGGKEFEALFAGGERTQDIEMVSSFGQQSYLVRMKLPDGYTPQDLQPKIERATPWGNFVTTYAMDGNTLVAETHITISTLRIPAKESKAFTDFLHAFFQEENKQILLTKK